MSTTEAGSGASGMTSLKKVDMKLEVVVIPVSDADRAKEHSRGLGWRLDADVVAGDFRLIQFTPPGSGCSVQFGRSITPSAESGLINLRCCGVLPSLDKIEALLTLPR